MSKEQSLVIPETFKIGDTEINKETLIARRDIDTKHVIKGVEDTTGYKEAIKYRASYRTVRTTLVKVTRELSEPHKAYIKKLKETTEELGKIAFGAETFFDSQITAIDQEKERIKLEKQVEEAKQLSLRINDLQVLGAMFDGETYYFPYNEAYAITLLDLKLCTNEKFDDFLEDVKTAFAEEQTRLHELKIRLEAEQLQRDNEAEEQRQLALTNQANEKALLEKRTKLRVKELTLMGFKWNDTDQLFISSTYRHDYTLVEIQLCTDEEWEELIEAIERIAINNTEPLKSEIEAKRNTVVELEFQNPLTPDEAIPIATYFSRGFQGGMDKDSDPAYMAAGIDPYEAVMGEPQDYSLNDFENVVKSSYKGTAKQKALILDAVADYKLVIDQF